MLDRIRRIATANQTLDIIRQGHYTNARNERVDIRDALGAAQQGTIHYAPTDFEQVFALRDQMLRGAARHSTRFEVTGETSMEAARRLCADERKLLCLNFASAKKPGGGFLTGAQAQEESLARASGLYPCIVQHKRMYDTNRALKTGLYTDHMIYSPAVPVWMDDEGRLLDAPYPLSIITAPAVNAGVVRRQEPENAAQIAPVMLARTEKVLSLAVVHGYTTLVLGAWGCGIFQHQPDEVAAWFEQCLVQNAVFQGAFARVVFAVYTGKDPANRLAFEERFG